MKRKSKKVIGFFAALAFSVSLLSISAYAAEDYAIDLNHLAAIEGDAFYSANDDMGFGGGYVGFLSGGKAWKIGTLDLSKYSSVEITYGSDGGALFAEGSNTFLALTQNGATQNSDYTTKEDAQILARTEQLAAPAGSWGAGKTTVTIDLSADYNGEVWMAYNMEEINGRQDGVIVSAVRFIAVQEQIEEKPEEGNQPAEGEDYEINLNALEAIEGDAFYSANDDMGFGGGYVGFLSGGKAWKIGTLDLSKYSSVEITYGSDGGALFAEGSNTFLALTQNGATQNSDYTTKEDAQILARTEQLAAPAGSWGAGKTTVTIDLSADYNGEVWMAYNMEEINGRQDGVIVSAVRFIAKKADPAEPTAEPATPPDQTPNSDTADDGGSILLGVLLMVQIAAAVSVSQKRMRITSVKH